MGLDLVLIFRGEGWGSSMLSVWHFWLPLCWSRKSVFINSLLKPKSWIADFPLSLCGNPVSHAIFDDPGSWWVYIFSKIFPKRRWMVFLFFFLFFTRLIFIPVSGQRKRDLLAVILVSLYWHFRVDGFSNTWKLTYIRQKENSGNSQNSYSSDIRFPACFTASFHLLLFSLFHN